MEKAPPVAPPVAIVVIVKSSPAQTFKDKADELSNAFFDLHTAQ